MVARLWRGSAPLTGTGILMMGVLAAAVAGLAIDPRIVTGVPVWLKPAKFAVSIAIYSFTLAWIFSLMHSGVTARRRVGWITAAALVLEMAIIGGQAARGTTSHFNTATPMDRVLFAIMGVAILIQTLSTIAVAIALWRERFEDAALGWALRLGMAITIVGAATGGLMTSPTRQQIEAARAGERMTITGAHTVGAPDGGPGLPGTGWSTAHGDLRVPHFLGLHAMQGLPLVALLLPRRRLGEAHRVRLILIAAAGYAGLFGILLSQALRGYPVAAPDGLTLALLAGWAFSVALAVVAATLRPALARRPAVV